MKVLTLPEQNTSLDVLNIAYTIKVLFLHGSNQLEVYYYFLQSWIWISTQSIHQMPLSLECLRKNVPQEGKKKLASTFWHSPPGVFCVFSLYLFISISIERAMMHFQKEISFRLPQHLVLKEGANFLFEQKEDSLSVQFMAIIPQLEQHLAK